MRIALALLMVVTLSVPACYAANNHHNDYSNVNNRNMQGQLQGQLQTQGQGQGQVGYVSSTVNGDDIRASC